MNKEKIIIDNLKCGGCVNTVIKELKTVEGIQNIKVDLESSTIEFEKEESTSRITVVEKLAKIGYPEQGTSNMIQKAKSYVSCMLGKLDE